jgi:hypothetical protein
VPARAPPPPPPPPPLSDFLSASLQLEHNQITGSLPTSLSTLTALTVLNLAHNKLTGTLPSELAHLSGSIESLRLEDNFLCGAVPPALHNVTSAISDFQALYNHAAPGCPCCSQVRRRPQAPSGARTLYSDAKVANRNAKVWHDATENGP